MAVADVTNSAHASIEIITNESVSTYLLPNALATLRVRWPKTTFAVTVATCSGVRNEVKDGHFDIGLLLEADEPTNKPGRLAIANTVLASERVVVAKSVRLVIFGASFHPLITIPAVGSVRTTELAEYPLFISDAAGDFHTLVSRFFESDGVPGPHLEACGSVEAVKRAVASDSRALGVLPAYAIAEEIQTRHFAVLNLRPPPPGMRLEALFSNHRARHPAVVEIINGMRDSLKEISERDASRSWLVTCANNPEGSLRCANREDKPI
jgi:DNA-binding transcriptional LysR family regulator